LRSKKIRNTHKVQIKDEAIIAAVGISQRYILLPLLEQTIDLMDEAASIEWRFSRQGTGCFR
jgi:ATP-dependent Clp protease ATP-binding subunit ClpB